MVIENQIPKTETVYELKDEYKVPSFEEFMKNYENDGNLNYDDLSGGSVGETKGYGPTNDGADCYKYCYYCRKDVYVSSSSNSYCSQCGTAFGTVSKTTTGLQKLNSDAGQRVVNNYGDRVERSGGEVKVKIGDEDVEITYKRN